MVTLITLIFVIPAAYAFARLDFPAEKRQRLAMLSSAVNMFTGAVLLIPLYRVLRTLGLLNTYWAMIVPGRCLPDPDGDLVACGPTLKRSRSELEEAAYVDGASRMYILRRVVLPLAVPGLIVVSTTRCSSPPMPSSSCSPSPLTKCANCNRCPPGLYEFIGYQDP